MEYKRICVNPKCKREFTTNRHNQSTCGPSCQIEMNRIRNYENYIKRKMPKAKCKYCGKEFIKGRGMIYCSPSCKEAYHFENANTVNCHCVVCGSDFKAEFKTDYCSETCRTIARNLGLSTKSDRRKKKRDPISIKAAEARAQGISYGQLVAKEYIEQQKASGTYWMSKCENKANV
jgi:predicted nucleic acid-binding Zn ribbon protein